jgi:putative membrane protein
MAMVPLALFILQADFDGHMDWDGDGGWGVLMILGMVLFWALVIGGVVWLLREVRGSREGRVEADQDPLKILDRRLADGSITPDDYRERRAVLTDQGNEPDRN